MEYIGLIIYIILAWNSFNYFQNKKGIVFFGSIGHYFLLKLMFCVFFGAFTIPIWLIIVIFSAIFGKKKG